MKKYLIKSSAFTLALAMMLGLASCGKQEVVETTTDVASIETVSDITTTQSTATQTTAQTEVATEIVTDAQGNTQVVSVTQAEDTTTANGDSKVSTNSDSKVSPTTKATTKTTVKATTKTTQKSTQKDTTKSTTKKTTASSVKYAGKGDERAVAQAVIKWINYYRVQEGKKAAIEMPGKATQYAQGRSKQLVTNFAHDWGDEKKVLNSMKYGRFVESYEWNGKTIEGYYQTDLSSAITAMINMSNHIRKFTVDDAGKEMAQSFRDSKGHWSYVGDADSDGYNYIAAGVTYNNGNWYCDIEMATENIDNTGYYK